MNKFLEDLKIVRSITKVVRVLPIVVAGITLMVTLMYFFMSGFCGSDWVRMLFLGSLIYLFVNFFFNVSLMWLLSLPVRFGKKME